MTRVAIVSASIVYGDAVGNDIQHMRRSLTALGHEVQLFEPQPYRREPSGEHIRALPSYLRGRPSALLIYHHAIGWQSSVRIVAEARCKRVLRYHNITPARFYDPIDTTYAGLCRSGRKQLREIIRVGCDLYLSDSPYNQGELLEHGADPNRCQVLPPFHHLDRLHDIQPDPEVLRDYGDGATNLLFVGRRVPNKGHRFLIDAFAAYHRHFDPRSRLLLVGKGDPLLGKYTDGLREQVWRLGLQGCVLFLESATEAELKAYYQTASVFVVASEHEGFCVPVVEAMALKVPIVAYGTTAVTHTVGDAGLVWDEPNPFLLAQSIAVVTHNQLIRRQLTERGWRRYWELFDNHRIERAFLNAVGPLLSAPRQRHQRAVSTLTEPPSSPT